MKKFTLQADTEKSNREAMKTRLHKYVSGLYKQLTSKNKQ